MKAQFFKGVALNRLGRQDEALDTLMKAEKGGYTNPDMDFEIAEPIGWDLELQIHKYLFPHLAASAEPSPLVQEKVEKGELGAKTGKGFYEWTPETLEQWRQNMTATLVRLTK